MSALGSLSKKPWFGPLLALLCVYGLSAALAPDTFLGGLNLVTMLSSTVVVSVTAIGMTLIIVHGGIDLSVGSTVALTTVVVARCLQSGTGPVTTVLVALALGALAGLLNGSLVVGLRITPFIATLGTMSALRGAAKGLAHEQKIDAPARGLDQWMAIVPGERFVPYGVWLALGVAIMCALVLGYTRLGRHAVAVGSNELTARLCGVPVTRVRLIIYALGGLLAGLAGVLEFSTLTVGDPTDSVGLELDAIAAVVIGGGSLAGGQGSVSGTLVGALLLTVIKAGGAHLGMPNWIQEILTGCIIVAASALDRVRQTARD
jgi:ribose/xylose/arabinose/galactoside ABC-type transport system permease subunit